MLEFGYAKLLLIFVVVLIFIGPKQLPDIARTVGRLWGKFHSFINEAKAQLNQVGALDEIEQLKAEVENSYYQAQSTLRQQFDEVKHSIEQPIEQATSSLSNSQNINSSSSHKSDFYLVTKKLRLKRIATPKLYKRELNIVRQQLHNKRSNVPQLRRKIIKHFE